jgi:hypothetical protein
MVDRLADTRWLRGRAGAQASWAHYEHHVRARQRADRNAARGAAVLERARQRSQRLAQHGPPRVLPRWQTTIARMLGQSTVSTPSVSTPPEGEGR